MIKELKDISVEFLTYEIIYVTSDGARFKTKEEAEIHDKPLRRKAHYEYLLTRRNWFQKLFNLEPDTSVWDMYDF